MIDELLKFNREFVKSKGYERFINNKQTDILKMKIKSK